MSFEKPPPDQGGGFCYETEYKYPIDSLHYTYLTLKVIMVDFVLSAVAVSS